MTAFHLRLENHWLACMAAVGNGGRITRTIGGMVVVNPGIAGYAFNFILLRAVEPARLTTAIELGGALLAGGERPPAVFLSPLSGDPVQLAAGLTEMGWRRLLRQVVLVRDLSDWTPPAPDPAVTVERVAGHKARVWGRILAEAYEVDPITGKNVAAAWGAMLQAPADGWRAIGYLAELAGSPAGTALLCHQGDLAGLYCGAVLPAFRRKGVHRATVTKRLSDAVAGGCRWATLQTEAGSPVETLCTGALGFTVAYHRELWVPRSAGGVHFL